MALKMMFRDWDGGAVVSLDGRVVLGKETSALREAVKSLLAEGKKNIVLDLNNVSFIDSAGLGTLVAAYSSAKSKGASLRLRNVGSRFKELLQITKLYTVFDDSDIDADTLHAVEKKAANDTRGSYI